MSPAPEFAGRILAGTGFEGDDGSADPVLLRAMQEPDDERALMERMSAARLLVPVVAGDRQREQTSTDMSSVTITAPDGQRALPAFTSIAVLSAWDPDARPVPVAAARAAQAAVAERCEVMIVDLGADVSVVLRPSMVWALAQQRAWCPAYEDPFVVTAVRHAAHQEPDVAAVLVEAGEPVGAGVLRIALALRPGLDARAVQALVTRVGERIATDGEARGRIDAINFAIRPS